MAVKFNALTGNFDLTGSGGGSYIDGEVATRADLEITLGSPAIGDCYLVRTASGSWGGLINRYPAGLYVRTANAGALDDWTYAGVFPDIFSDAVFMIYDDSNTARQLQIELTDNETLTFKLTGADAVVRTVAFPLS
jgi:hypothetical protein